MRLNQDFLNTYNDSLLAAIKNDSTLNGFKNMINKESYKSYCQYDYQETYDYLLSVKQILDKITSIVFNPHIKATSEEVIIRSELSASLSNDSFKQTIADSKLWRRKDGEMSPEYVHTEQYIDTFVTYENTFICMLVDAISDDVDEIVSNITPLVKSLEQQFEAKGVSYGKYSMLNELDTNGLPLAKDFLVEKVSSKEVIALAHKLIKRIKNIKVSEFYRFNKKNKIDKNIQPTNILIHDQLYSNCYRFWLDNYVVGDYSYFIKRNTSYYNYFISTLLTYLDSQINDKVKLFIENERIRFDEIRFDKGLFTYIIHDDDNRLGISIETILNVSKTEQIHANYYLLTTLKYDEANQPGVDEVLNEKKKTYSDVILVCQNNLIGRFNNLLNISIYQDFNEILIKNALASMSLLFECDDLVYETICPVCGSKHPILDDDAYECSNCHARYVITRKNKKPILWIKSLRRE